MVENAKIKVMEPERVLSSRRDVINKVLRVREREKTLVQEIRREIDLLKERKAKLTETLSALRSAKERLMKSSSGNFSEHDCRRIEKSVEKAVRQHLVTIARHMESIKNVEQELNTIDKAIGLAEKKLHDARHVIRALLDNSPEPVTTDRVLREQRKVRRRYRRVAMRAIVRPVKKLTVGKIIKWIRATSLCPGDSSTGIGRTADDIVRLYRHVVGDVMRDLREIRAAKNEALREAVEKAKKDLCQEYQEEVCHLRIEIEGLTAKRSVLTEQLVRLRDQVVELQKEKDRVAIRSRAKEQECIVSEARLALEQVDAEERGVLESLEKIRLVEEGVRKVLDKESVWDGYLNEMVTFLKATRLNEKIGEWLHVQETQCALLKNAKCEDFCVIGEEELVRIRKSLTGALRERKIERGKRMWFGSFGRKVLFLIDTSWLMAQEWGRLPDLRNSGFEKIVPWQYVLLKDIEEELARHLKNGANGFKADKAAIGRHIVAKILSEKLPLMEVSFEKGPWSKLQFEDSFHEVLGPDSPTDKRLIALGLWYAMGGHVVYLLTLDGGISYQVSRYTNLGWDYYTRVAREEFERRMARILGGELTNPKPHENIRSVSWVDGKFSMKVCR